MRTYLKQYLFENHRVISIDTNFKVFDNDECISNRYSNLYLAEKAVEDYITKTLGLNYNSKKLI